MRAISELVCCCWIKNNTFPCLSNKSDIPSLFEIESLISQVISTCLVHICFWGGWLPSGKPVWEPVVAYPLHVAELFISGFLELLFTSLTYGLVSMAITGFVVNNIWKTSGLFMSDIEKHGFLRSVEQYVRISVQKRFILVSMDMFVFFHMQNLRSVKAMAA